MQTNEKSNLENQIPIKPAVSKEISVQAEAQAIEKKIFWENLEKALAQHGSPRPHWVLEMGSLDKNIEHIRSQLGRKVDIRLNAEALPNPSLLLYISEKLKTKKISICEAGFLTEIWQHPGFAGFDILYSSSLPPQMVQNLFTKIDSSLIPRALNQTAFLVGNIDEIVAWQKVAASLKTPVKIFLNMVFGSSDFGFRKFSDLERALKRIEQMKNAFSLQGIFISDGFEKNSPSWFSKWISRPETRYARTQSRILKVKEILRNSGFRSNPLVSGGASSTFSLHARGTHLDEINLGSQFQFSPNPAAYLSAPVLGFENHFFRPFFGFLGPLFSNLFHPKDRLALVPLSNKDFLIPLNSRKLGIQFAPLNKMIRENHCHSQVWIPKSLNKKVGEPLVALPKNSRAMRNFNEVLLVRNGQVLGTSRNFQQRF